MNQLTATPPSSPALPGAHRGNARRRLGRWIGPALAIAVAGVAVGRFVAPDGVQRSAGVAASADALAAAREVTVQKPDSPDAWLAYGTLALQRAALDGDPAWYAVAGDAIDAAQRLAPARFDVLTAQAATSLATHDFPAAVVLADQAVTANPFSVAALAASVDAHVEMGDLTEASAVLDRLAAVRPGVELYARVSYLRQLTGDRSGAITAMQQAVATTVGGAERATVSTYLGDLLLESGRSDDALRAYERALDDQPMMLGASLGRARALMAVGSMREAIAAADAVVARSPQPAAAQLRGELALLTGDREAARQAFALVDAGIRLQREQGVTLDLELALFLADHGDPAAAVEAAQRAYTVRQTAFTADALGWALVRAGRADEGERYIDEALAHGSESPALLVHAAAAADATGDATAAHAFLTRALVASPWLTPAIQPTAAELASRLGVTLPEGWTL